MSSRQPLSRTSSSRAISPWHWWRCSARRSRPTCSSGRRPPKSKKWLPAIPILAGSAGYALKEFLGIRGDLASKPRHRPTFYVILAAATIAGVVMNFMHLDPIHALFVTAVVNGVVAPPLLVLIVWLGTDWRIMKHRVSGRLSLTLTGLATCAMAVAALTLLVGLIPFRLFS